MSGYKKLTAEEYERITKENMELFAKLDRQIAEERREYAEKLASMTDEEQVDFMRKENRKLDREARGKFKKTVVLSENNDA